MDKNLIIFGVAVLLICVAFSGCIGEQKATEKDEDTKDIVEKTYFILSGNITNNYFEDIDIDFIVSAEYYTDWYYSTVNDEATIRLSPYEVKEYSCQVKKGYDRYFFMISWYYTIGEQEQGDFADVNFSNPNFEDVIYHVEVKSNKELEVSKTFHLPNPNKAPKAEANADTTKGIPPLTVSFIGSGTDDDGNITSYHWDFKDGSISNEQNPIHTFLNSGTYDVKLVVTDDKGATGSDIISIKVESLAIIEHMAYEEYGDSVRIVGLVKNFGNSNIKEIKITATIYNAIGSMIGFDSVYTNMAGEYSGIIKSQETTGFWIGFSAVPDYNHYEVEITSYSTTYTQPYHDKLQILNVHENPRNGYFYVSGTIRNLGNEDASSIKVYVNLFNSNNRLIDIEESYVATIHSGKSDYFNVWVWKNPDIDRYEVQVTCWEYSWD
jgi:PKD repeat protein